MMRRSLICESLEPRRLLAGDAGDMLVEFRFTDAGGDPQSVLVENRDYTLEVYVQDIRDNPTGVFKAYFDVAYNSALLSVDGVDDKPTPGPDYLDVLGGDTSVPGLIDDAGGLDTDQSPPVDPTKPLLLFSVPVRAEQAGSLTLSPGLGNQVVFTRVPQFFFSSSAVPFSDICFTGQSIDIIPAGVLVTPTTGLTTTEAPGGNASFDLVLTQQPTSDVAIDLRSLDLSEGTVSTNQVVFNDQNWNVAQSVVVTGVNDDIDDGDITYTIELDSPTSSDARFTNIDVPDVTVVNIDDDTAGFSVSISGADTTVSESGSSDTFTVVLSTQPASNVIVAVTESASDEASVDKPALVFTPANWNVAQTVTVTGVNDQVADGDQNSTITLEIDDALSDDAFDALPNQTVSVVTTDDDQPSVRVEITGASTIVSETQTSDTFSVVLGSQPTSDVVLTVISSDTGEAVVDKSTLTFDASNWDTAQVVTVSGVDDFIDDDDQTSTITISVNDALSDDAFDNLLDQLVSVVTTDDDFVGFTISETSGATTVSEPDTSDTFTVVLNAAPIENVVLQISGVDATEFSLDKQTLTFTSANWNVPQTVNVVAENDDQDDGDQTTALSIAVDDAQSDDAFDALADQTVSVTTLDDDEIAVLIVETLGGTIVDEDGSTDMFTVVLGAAPASDVVLLVSQNDPGEIMLDQTALTFTPADWDQPQTVIVTGQNDDVADGDQITPITISVDDAASDDSFDSLPDQTVDATTVDDDAAGITVEISDGETIVDESGSMDTFTVVLDSQPLSNVVVSLSNSDPTETSVNPALLTFTSQNWDTAQTVTVTGLDDEIDDGAQSTTITIAIDDAQSDDTFDEVADEQVTVTTNDDDEAIFIVEQTGSDTTVAESGTTDFFTVVLGARPLTNVVIDVVSNDTSEVEVSTNSLVFTPENWDVPLPVTVTGVDDTIDDDDQTTPVRLSIDADQSDSAFDLLPDQEVPVLTLDDDGPGFNVLQSDGSTVVAETPTTDTFSVVLNIEPAGTVVLDVAVSDPSEASIDKISLTFTPADWDDPQIVTISGEDDNFDDGDQQSTITIGVNDALSDDTFDPLDDKTLTVTTTDDDEAGFTIAASGTDTRVDESATTDTFTVVLDAQPVSEVVLDVSSGDETEATVTPGALTFSTTNWNVPQQVTITGVNDDVDDGDQATSITVAVNAALSDSSFAAVSSQTLEVITTDDDDAGISVTITDGDTIVSEAGSLDEFAVTLDTQPISNVVLFVNSNNTSEATTDKASLTFTPANWDVPQTVVVQGADDDVDDGDRTTQITLSVDDANSDDAYDPLGNRNVSVLTTDDDTAGVTLAATGENTTVSESQTSDAFTVVLDAQPLVDVVLSVSINDPTEATADRSELTFTPTNWNVAQSVTVTGVEDALVDGDQISVATVSVDQANSDDAFDAVPAQTISITTLDNDIPGFTVSQSNASTVVSENGTTDAFAVTLNVQPTSDVHVTVVSDAPDVVAVDKSLLVFTPANWDVPQSVTASTGDDSIIQGDRTAAIRLAIDPDNSDDDFDSVSDQSVTATAVDDDVAGVNVNPVGGTATTEAGGAASFQISLSAQPSAEVKVELSMSDGSEASIDTSELTFDDSNWNTPQTVVVTGEDDTAVDGDIEYLLELRSLTSLDTNFDQVDPDDVVLSNEDDDSAQVAISTVTSVQSESAGGSTTVFEFEVLLSGEVEGGFSIAFSTNDQTATAADGDYVDNDGQLSFSGSDGQRQTITVTVNDDDKVEADEIFDVALTELTGVSASADENISISGSPAAATITNDDSTTVTISDANLTEGTGPGSSTLSFSVTLSNPVQGGFDIGFSSVDGTATTVDGDYTPSSGTLVFAGTSNEVQSIPISVARDATVETDENLGVELGAISGTTLADSINVVDRSASGSIADDDSATVAFVTAASEVAESLGSHTVRVTLSVAGGGSLGEDLPVDVMDAGGGSATSADFSLISPSIVFPAGSTTGTTRDISLNIADDADVESEETVNLGLAIGASGISSRASIAQPNLHTVTITDDPMTASVSGQVWIDANNNGRQDAGEPGLPGVRVTLSGQDARGLTVEIIAMTGNDGGYAFNQLPGGTYSVSQEHPQAFIDGQEVLGSVAGGASGVAANDRFDQIIVGPGQAATNYDFGEIGLRARYVSRRLFLASAPPQSQMLREVVARGESSEGNASRAAEIQAGVAPEIRRIGSEVTVTGTTQSDVIKFVPATSSESTSESEHQVEVNGLSWQFPASEVSRFMFDGVQGNDTVELVDTAGNDQVEVTQTTAALVNDRVRAEVRAFDIVHARSVSGGNDTAERDSLTDFLLELEGDWIQL